MMNTPCLSRGRNLEFFRFPAGFESEDFNKELSIRDFWETPPQFCHEKIALLAGEAKLLEPFEMETNQLLIDTYQAIEPATCTLHSKMLEAPSLRSTAVFFVCLCLLMFAYLIFNISSASCSIMANGKESVIWTAPIYIHTKRYFCYPLFATNFLVKWRRPLKLSACLKLRFEYRITILAILCDHFWIVKSPFQRISDLHLEDKKVILNHLDFLQTTVTKR